MGYVRGAEEGCRHAAGRKPVLTETGGYYVEPTIFEASPSMRIAREEIFGPVLSVLTFATSEEAVRIANGTDYGLPPRCGPGTCRPPTG